MNQTGQVQAMPEINVICEQCGGEHHDPLNFICPECGCPLSIIYDYEQLSGSIDKESFKRKTTGVWRYKFLLPPISVKNQTSLGEGGTPLVACRNLGEELGLTKLYAKLECLNPTGSFKDRGSAVGVSFARARCKHWVLLTKYPRSLSRSHLGAPPSSEPSRMERKRWTGGPTPTPLPKRS